MDRIHDTDNPRLVDNIVCEVKSQGVFDQFRRECMADVDTKPAYQNLRQRVENSVANFLSEQEWKPDLNKNQLREKLRKNITETGFLETGVERIVDQVVNPKINTTFLPKIEEISYKYLGIEKPKMIEKTNAIDNGNGMIDVNTDFFPTDLEAVSPDSDKSNHKSFNDSTENLNISGISQKIDLNDSGEKIEDFESPAFELLEGRLSSSALSKADDDDSKLSAISGLTSQESVESCENLPKDNAPVAGIESASISQTQPNLSEVLNQDSELSQVSSNSHLSIVTSSDSNKSHGVDISEEAQMPKFNESSGSSNSNPTKEKKPLMTSFDIKQDEIVFEGTDRRLSISEVKDEYKLSVSDFKNEYKVSVSDVKDEYKLPVSEIKDEYKPMDVEQEEMCNMNSISPNDDITVKTESSSSITAPITIETKNLSIKDDIKMELEAYVKAEESTILKPQPISGLSQASSSEKDKNKDHYKSYRRDRDRERDRHSSSSHNKDKYKDIKYSSSSSSRHGSSSSSKYHSRSKNEVKLKISYESSKRSDSSKSKSDTHKPLSSSSKHSSHSTPHSSSRDHERSRSGTSTSHHRDKRSTSESHSRDKDKNKRDSRDNSTKSHKSNDKLKRRSDESDKKKSTDSTLSKPKKVDDDHSIFREKPIERRRSTDRDSNDGQSNVGSRNSSSSKNRTETNSVSSTASKTSTSSSPSSSSSSSCTDAAKQMVNTTASTISPQIPLPPAVVHTLPKLPIHRTESEEDFVLPTMPVVVDQMLTGNDINLELLIEQNVDGTYNPVMTSIHQTLTGNNIKIKKPKVASNIFEARKLMKIRKQMERDEKKRIEQALVMAKQYISNNAVTTSGFGIEKQGVELEFACMGSRDGGVGSVAPSISSPVKTPEKVELREDSLVIAKNDMKEVIVLSDIVICEKTITKPNVDIEKKEKILMKSNVSSNDKVIKSAKDKMIAKSKKGKSSSKPDLFSNKSAIKSEPKTKEKYPVKSETRKKEKSRTKSDGDNKHKNTIKPEAMVKPHVETLSHIKRKLSIHSDDELNEDIDEKHGFAGFPVKKMTYPLNKEFIEFSEQLNDECNEFLKYNTNYSDTAYLLDTEDEYKSLFKTIKPNVWEFENNKKLLISNTDEPITKIRKWSDISKFDDTTVSIIAMKQLQQLKVVEGIMTNNTDTDQASNGGKNGIKKSIDSVQIEQLFLENNQIDITTDTQSESTTCLNRKKKTKLSDPKEHVQKTNTNNDNIQKRNSDEGYNNNLVKRMKNEMVNGDDIVDTTKNSPTPSEQSVGSKENKFVPKIKNAVSRSKVVQNCSNTSSIAAIVVDKELFISSGKKSTPNTIRASKRYSSDDLYKPRPILMGSRTRKRGFEHDEM